MVDGRTTLVQLQALRIPADRRWHWGVFRHLRKGNRPVPRELTEISEPSSAPDFWHPQNSDLRRRTYRHSSVGPPVTSSFELAIRGRNGRVQSPGSCPVSVEFSEHEVHATLHAPGGKNPQEREIPNHTSPQEEEQTQPRLLPASHEEHVARVATLTQGLTGLEVSMISMMMIVIVMSLMRMTLLEMMTLIVPLIVVVMKL